MQQVRIPAAFMRGGTSKGLFFRSDVLPAAQAEWDPIFLAAIGSPDPNGRQLDGMGGGISSLSKVVVVGPASRPDADLDYTFGQVSVTAALVDYRSNCGNLTSAVGPFAVDEGLVPAVDGEMALRLHNTNSGKIVLSSFPVSGERAEVDGDAELAGVAGHGAAIRLAFQDPGGAATGRLLPTGRPLDRLEVPGLGTIESSLVDATTAAVFVSAADLGITGTELPAALEAQPVLLERLAAVRRQAARAMGLPDDAESVPKVGFVAPPVAAQTLAGATLPAEAMDLNARMISMGQPHRALPLTGAMCLAVAARIAGTLVHEAAGKATSPGDLRVAHPSGLVALDARVRQNGGWVAEEVTVLRTARRLMEGHVLVPASRLQQAAESRAARAVPA